MRAGDGETDDGLHSVFRAAWEAQLDTPVPIYGSGHNILPTIHIADLAAYVAAVCIEPPVQQYLLAVDDAKLSQQEIVAAIADRMGNAPVKEQTLEELYFQQVASLTLHGTRGVSSLGIHLPGKIFLKHNRSIAALQSLENEVQEMQVCC